MEDRTCNGQTRQCIIKPKQCFIERYWTFSSAKVNPPSCTAVARVLRTSQLCTVRKWCPIHMLSRSQSRRNEIYKLSETYLGKLMVNWNFVKARVTGLICE